MSVRPDHKLAQALDLARREAGLTTAQLAKALSFNPRTVRRYLNGERRPGRDTVQRWEEVCRLTPGALTALHDSSPAGPEPPRSRARLPVRSGAGVRERFVGRRPRSPLGFRGYLVGAAAVAVLAIVVLGVRSRPDDLATRPAGVVLRVDNRTTSGREAREDPARLPLTTRPVPGCGRRGCVVDGTPTWESKQWIDRAVCRQRGERMTNGNDASKADDDNPLLDDTNLYYGVMLEDGTAGYVAEIWIARDQRGGLGLPPCRGVLPRLAER